MFPSHDSCYVVVLCTSMLCYITLHSALLQRPRQQTPLFVVINLDVTLCLGGLSNTQATWGLEMSGDNWDDRSNTSLGDSGQTVHLTTMSHDAKSLCPRQTIHGR